ncbi:70 kDa peptidyl-prolyl isomerase isoform X2 [Physcomitrium patens]|uniref:peptidylprolyl isomerase n=2 Tax=Physcomitrium patens TaxID=3218 RepID=A0A7I4BAX1_PHYPA
MEEHPRDEGKEEGAKVEEEEEEEEEEETEEEEGKMLEAPAGTHVCNMHDKEDEEEGAAPDASNNIGKEVKLLKNGGVVKKLVRHGTDPSPETPLFGDEVTVHYTGSLPDGTVFDSTRDKEPFTFKLGVGQVIRGWDKGVKTMRKGEQAIFTISPDYAYGKGGQPPAIPPDTKLTFDIELLSWCSVKDVTRDGGVMKKVVREGKSWERPKEADEVKVKYEAKLVDGTVVSKSPEEGLYFFIKDGLFCPAMAHAVKSMKKGEGAVLTIQPEYGFGIKGREGMDSEGAVPPNATLIMDLEIMGWNSVEKVSDDDKVVKKITRQGESYEKPNDGTTATVKWIGTLSDGTVFEKKGFDSEEPFTVVIDEGQVVPGLDETFASMKKGEICIATVPSEYGYEGEEKQCDLAVVPANSTLTYEVEMVSFVKEKDSWDLDGPQKIVMAAKKKDQGNELFKQGKLLHASKKYEKVLETDSMNVKALYRRAQAYTSMMDLDLAEQDIKKALEIDPENRDMKLEQRKLSQRQAAHRRKEAKQYGNMFDRLRKMEEKELKQSEVGLPDQMQENVLQENSAQENPVQPCSEVSVQG